MKIKCFRFECSECGEISSIQVFYRKDGSIGYARARHKNAHGFYYHKQSNEYVKEKLGELCKLDQGQYKPIDPYLSNSSSNHKIMAGGEGFEPSTPNLGAFANRGIDWEGFKQSLKEMKYRGCYDAYLFNVAMQYKDCILNRDLSLVKQLPKDKRARVLKALSSLAKYLGVYEDYQKLIHNFGLTWTGRTADDMIIDRMNRSDDPEEIWQWVRDAKECRPEYSEFFDLIAVTGLRFSEAYNCYNLVIQLTKEKTLTEKYFNVNTGMLEHFRYRDIFLRDCKKAFVSFVPLELLEAIGKKDSISRPYVIKKNLARRHMAQRFSDVREAHATYMTKFLKEIEIDVLQGRISGSVFKTHYLNIKLIADLKSRANLAAQEIMAKIKMPLEVNVEAKDRF